jgi:hypothetical protein
VPLSGLRRTSRGPRSRRERLARALLWARQRGVLLPAALAGSALVVLALVTALLARDRETTDRPPVLPSRDLSAERFLDSVGVVTHFNYIDTTYARRAELVELLRELGVRHLRDAMPQPDQQPLIAGLQAARDIGIKATLHTGDVKRPPDVAVADAQHFLAGGIEAFEGPNEPDNNGDPAWPETVRAYMPALDAAVRRRAPGVGVLGPAFVHPVASRGLLPADLPGLANEHPYSGGEPPERALGTALRNIPAPLRRRGVVITEAGFHNALRDTKDQPPSSEEAAAAYLPRVLLSAFGAGVRRTFVYELVDEKPDDGLADAVQRWGLVRRDLSRKPAFGAVRTLLAAVRASPGPATGPGPSWRLRTERSVQRVTLRRRDGSRVLALWRPVSVWDTTSRTPVTATAVPAELAFDVPARDVAVWRPSTSGRPVLRRASVKRVSFDVGADVVLVSMR